MFGPEAAKDPIIVLVAGCSTLPLYDFGDHYGAGGRLDEGLLQFIEKPRKGAREEDVRESETINHSDEFIEEFALKFHAHSECVARRIARELWERKRVSPTSNYITVPRDILTWVDSMKEYKVPGTKEQEMVVEDIIVAAAERAGESIDDPGPIYKRWAMVKERAYGPGGVLERSDVAQILKEETEDVGQEAREAEFAREIAAGRRLNNPRGRPVAVVPTPIHLLWAIYC
jgi:hypothetical protein